MYQLRYTDLWHPGKAFSFPCDEQGHVNLDLLSEHAKESYLYVRAMVGRDYSLPVVQGNWGQGAKPQ